MDVYKFKKSLLDRYQEVLNVLSWNDYVITARDVRREWSAFVEMQIEPTGWQALWKVPRHQCKKYNLSSPIMVFGMVNHVDFSELQTVFAVIAVQDKDIVLPDTVVVDLIDLWPTIAQENAEINVERTADVIDQLRFFYKNIWLPWDNENTDDRNWLEEHLELRIKFLCDLSNGAMSKPLTTHVRALLQEARDIGFTREQIEHEMTREDMHDNDADENEQLESKENVRFMMQLHLRLANIHTEVDILLNPTLRSEYEDLKFLQNLPPKMSNNVVHLIVHPNIIENHLDIIQAVASRVKKDQILAISSGLQDAITQATSDVIYVCPGTHALRYMETLHGNGSIIGIIPKDLHDEQKVTICSTVDDSFLMTFIGDYKLSNLTIDCSSVLNALLLKYGTVTLDNCHLVGETSRNRQAIWCNGPATLIVEKCTFVNFDTAIMAKCGSCLIVKCCEFRDCEVGIDIDIDATKIDMEDVSFIRNGRCGLLINSVTINNDAPSLKLNKYSELDRFQDVQILVNISGQCSFESCGANILLMNERKQLASKQSKRYIACDNGDSDLLDECNEPLQ